MSFSDLRGIRYFLGGILLILAAAAAAGLWRLGADYDYLGKGDFLAYWSAARLLRDGRNPYDPAAMLSTEQEFTHSSSGIPIMAVNPPTLFVLILPLAWLSFSGAKATWLVVNLALLLTSSWILMRVYAPSSRKVLLALCLFWALFPQTLVGILAGQVSYLVLLGLAGSMLLAQRGKWFWAGASLLATTVKPHMAVLAVPYLLLYMAYRRKWQGWLGLLASGGVSSLILFAFRPSWLCDLIGFLPTAPVRHWATPTLGGLMSLLQMGEFWRYLVVAFLPLPWLLARRHTDILPQTAVSLLTVITVPTTFFGWSYDQCMLLIPIAEILSWLLMPPVTATRAFVSAALLLLIVGNWLQRIRVTSEMEYLWIPVVVAILYVLFRLASRRSQHEPSALLCLG